MASKSILIIDDEEGIRTALSLALEYEGYAVHSATDGKDALEKLTKIPRPCLIFLDLMMPVMNGWQFVDEIKADPSLKNIPIIIVTAFAERMDSIQNRTEGILTKPILLKDLFQAAKKHCN